jgi:hypothetical protein
MKNHGDSSCGCPIFIGNDVEAIISEYFFIGGRNSARCVEIKL